FSIGIRGPYVLLALGESTKPLAKPEQGKRLIDRPEMKLLSRYADQRLTPISYRSKAPRSATSASMWDIHKWIDAGIEALPQSEFPADLQARIKKDLTNLSKELRS